MAMLSFLIRKARSSTVPFALRAISSSPTITRVFKMSNNKNTRFNYQQYSTSAVHVKKQFDQSFVDFLDSEIQSAKQSLLPESSDFPFEVCYDYWDGGYHDIDLRRNIHGEDIVVYVDMREIVQHVENNIARHYYEKGDHENNVENLNLPFVLRVSIKKGQRLYYDQFNLEVKVHDSFDNIELFVRTKNHDLRELFMSDVYQGLKKFLEIRGFNRINSKFFHNYMVQEYRKRDIKFLSELKEFVNK